MFAYIRGKLSQISPAYAVIETSGIGYKILMPSTALEKLNLYTDIHCFTSYVIREFSQNLYGFLTEEDRDLFNLLIDISGIGPKTALNLISCLPYKELEQVILEENTKALAQVPGIGKKTAERLLVELRNKLEHFFTHPCNSLHTTPAEQKHQDALKALLHLGYKHTAAKKALAKSLESNADIELSALIASALRHV